MQLSHGAKLQWQPSVQSSHDVHSQSLVHAPHGLGQAQLSVQASHVEHSHWALHSAHGV